VQRIYVYKNSRHYLVKFINGVCLEITCFRFAFLYENFAFLSSLKNEISDEESRSRASFLCGISCTQIVKTNVVSTYCRFLLVELMFIYFQGITNFL
jgi:hypothetical protein